VASLVVEPRDCRTQERQLPWGEDGWLGVPFANALAGVVLTSAVAVIVALID
jgi:hypothetical protein